MSSRQQRRTPQREPTKRASSDAGRNAGDPVPKPDDIGANVSLRSYMNDPFEGLPDRRDVLNQRDAHVVARPDWFRHGLFWAR